MDDATQKLVDGLRADSRDYGRKMRGEVEPGELISWDQSHVRAWEAADALEAAQRPPVSPEAREAIQALRAIEEADRVDHRGHVGDDGEPCGMGRTWMTRMGRDLAAALDHLDTALRGGELTREETNG